MLSVALWASAIGEFRSELLFARLSCIGSIVDA